MLFFPILKYSRCYSNVSAQKKDRTGSYDLSLHFTQIESWCHMNSLPLLVVSLELQELDMVSFVLSVKVQLKSAPNQPTLKLEHIAITPLSFQRQSMECAWKGDIFALKYLEGDGSEAKFQIQLSNPKYLTELERKFSLLKQNIHSNHLNLCTTMTNLASLTPQTQYSCSFVKESQIEEESTFLCESPCLFMEQQQDSFPEFCPICNHERHESSLILNAVRSFVDQMNECSILGSSRGTFTIEMEDNLNLSKSIDSNTSKSIDSNTSKSIHSNPSKSIDSNHSIPSIDSFCKNELTFIQTVKNLSLLGPGQKSFIKKLLLLK